MIYILQANANWNLSRTNGLADSPRADDIFKSNFMDENITF